MDGTVLSSALSTRRGSDRSRALGLLPDRGFVSTHWSGNQSHSLIAPGVTPIKWENGMIFQDSRSELHSHLRQSYLDLGKNDLEVAEYLEVHINRVANGRIRDLRVVYSDDSIVLQGRSRTYHAKQLAHQAVLDLTDGFPLLANQIVVA
jgi:hypothetical protein